MSVPVDHTGKVTGTTAHTHAEAHGQPSGGLKATFEALLQWKEWIGAIAAIIMSCWGALTYFATVNQLKAVNCNLHEMEAELNERMALMSYQDQIATYQHEQDEIQRADDPKAKRRLDGVISKRADLEAKRDQELKEIQTLTADRSHKCYEPLLFQSKETKAGESKE
jgi:hypothetical protein